jgi:hypothetical protein
VSVKDSFLKFDGFQLLAGADSGRPPYVLDHSQLSWLVNGTTRGGTVQCRPGWVARPLSFVDSTGVVDSVLQAKFETGGRWQGAGAYESDNGRLKLLASIGGRIFETDVNTFATQDLTETIANDLNNPAGEQAWFTQAENYLVIQNGEDTALVYDGATLARSYGSASARGGDGVPVGTCMAYNRGRLWVAIPQSNSLNSYSFVAGDLAYSGATGTRADVLKFTENTFLTGGGAFVVSAQAGPIRAMVSLAQQDSTTGQGPLQVITTKGAFSINAPFDRTQWQTTVNPIETISMLASGAVAQNSTVNVNGDIWFRAPDGVRSLMIARRDYGTWVNTPISNEVVRSLNYDEAPLLPFASAVLFDNRLLITSQPGLAKDANNNIRGVTWQSLLPLDFYPINSMAAELSPNVQPQWDGMWTGLQILQVLTVGSDNPRCFIYVLDTDSKIKLWELTKTAKFDGLEQRISWFLETPAYGFDTGGWNLRRLKFGDMWLSNIAGTLDIAAYYRPDADQTWRTWATGQTCAAFNNCTISNCTFPVPNLPQYRARMLLPEPTAVCDSTVDKPTDHGYRFSVRLNLTGYCMIPQFRLAAQDVVEDVVGQCLSDSCSLTAYPDTCQFTDLAYVTTT